MVLSIVLYDLSHSIDAREALVLEQAHCNHGLLVRLGVLPLLVDTEVYLLLQDLIVAVTVA